MDASKFGLYFNWYIPTNQTIYTDYKLNSINILLIIEAIPLILSIVLEMQLFINIVILIQE